MKNSIARIWAPNIEIERQDPRGSMLGQRDRVTVMQVTIDKGGKMTALSVANSSGVTYLDDEAVRTFNKAAPFPFPPRELFKNKEEFTFHFAFHVHVNRGLKFDFDWSAGG
ncbi:MAG TPA: energy transducer TonB [Myxococcota bacterium]|nr:energy transducer TonB [Myxococcota bacterium]